MSKIQFSGDTREPISALRSPKPIHLITGVRLPRTPTDTLYDIHICPSSSLITKITPHSPSSSSSSSQCTSSTNPGILPSTSSLLAPSLCHPHIHIDKAHLLSHPLYSSLQPQSGTFAEALSLTARAKTLFTEEDLLQRGNWVISESVAAGVTCMRAFVEVDEMVGLKSVEAGLQLRKSWARTCEVQICVFAQEAVFSGDDGGRRNRELVEEAAKLEGVDVVGSTPYVEGDREREMRNVDWAVELAIRERKHLDLHLDYHLDGGREPLVWYVLELLKKMRWVEKMEGKTICLGHCTRMTMFGREEWERLRSEADGLPISFVGLPTSDVFMMGRVRNEERWKDRERGTLQVLAMIQDLGLDAILGINNVGNAFTPQGATDPLEVASLGVGIYQAGTVNDAETLYECVSTRSKAAIGCRSSSLELKEGDIADLVLYGPPREKEPRFYRRRKTIQELVYNADSNRITLKAGQIVSTE